MYPQWVKYFWFSEADIPRGRTGLWNIRLQQRPYPPYVAWQHTFVYPKKMMYGLKGTHLVARSGLEGQFVL